MTVQIDESQFRHKPKVCMPCIYITSKILNTHLILQHHRGRATSREVWVFGLCDISQSPSLGYMEIVPSRDAATLLPINQAHVCPGTVIHSDQWRAYHHVASLPSVAGHSMVNHSLHFVDPSTGTHTQNIESYWDRVKTKIKRMKGCHATELASYLDEFMWRERFGKTKISAFRNICQDIATQYPV